MPFINCKIISFDTDARIYHKQKNAVKRGDEKFFISPSSLKEFSRCPLRWINGYESPESSSKNFGSLLDTRLLTPDLFDSVYAVKPETYKNEKGEIKPWNGNSNVCKQWLEDVGELKVVSKNELVECDTAIRALKSDEVISLFIEGGKRQVLIRGEWHDDKAKIIVPVECLIDVWPDKESVFRQCLGDLKCVRNGSIEAFERQIHQLGWHVQAAFDLDMAVAATGEDRVTWCFFGVENYQPFQPFRRMLGIDFLEMGQRKYKADLARYAICLKNKFWPGYDDHKEALQGWSLCQPSPWMAYDAQSDQMAFDQERELAESEPRDENAGITP